MPYFEKTISVENQLLDLLSNDRRQIVYRPEWREMTGSVLGAIMLQQVFWRWDKNDDKPFYKFKMPCGHPLYREGDSWTEELGFSKREIENSLKQIGQKLKDGTERKNDVFLWYWTTVDRRTFYHINLPYLSQKITELYVNTESHFTKIPNRALPKSRFELYVNTESGFRYNREELTEKNYKDEQQRASGARAHVREPEFFGNSENGVSVASLPEPPSQPEPLPIEKKNVPPQVAARPPIVEQPEMQVEAVPMPPEEPAVVPELPTRTEEKPKFSELKEQKSASAAESPNRSGGSEIEKPRWMQAEDDLLKFFQENRGQKEMMMERVFYKEEIHGDFENEILKVFVEKHIDNQQFLQNPASYFCKNGYSFLRKQKEIAARKPRNYEPKKDLGRKGHNGTRKHIGQAGSRPALGNVGQTKRKKRLSEYLAKRKDGGTDGREGSSGG